MNRKDLRKTSLEFRRISSNFLNSNDSTADVNLARFVKFIDENEFISGVIKEYIQDVDYDFRKCFSAENSGWARFIPPEDEKCHIKAQYDYLKYINSEDRVTVHGQALRYNWSSKKINDMIEKFLDMAFKPLIDFINDQISMEMIAIDEEQNTMTGNTYIQNIDTVNGTASQQNSGVINTYNSSGNTNDLIALVEKLIASLAEIREVDSEEIESVKDDLEMIQEQLKSETPKKSRIGKAMTGIKSFVEKFSINLGVSLATGAITRIDWDMLIQLLENFIK